MNFNFLGFFRKINIFWGYEDFVDSFWGSSQNWTILGSFLCILGSFLKAKVQNGGYFLGLLKFQFFFFRGGGGGMREGCLKFLIFLGGEG